MIETDTWPFVPARWYTTYTGKGHRIVRLVVIHDMEAPEKGDTAESVGRFFQNPGKNPDGSPKKPSSHIGVDNNTIVQYVKDNNIANAAPGANNDGIQIELAGYGSQTREQWLDEYSKTVLNMAAKATAQYLLKYDIPPVHLTNAQLKAGKKGIIGHYQASEVYHKSNHTDPGKDFPWDYFMRLVVAYYDVRKLQFNLA